ncbi:MAG TPA: GGDEF domain-containing protein, partial [Ramlibacter sp.]|nr:GGDEF domain-containing protein [Ramlibacter sp.]
MTTSLMSAADPQDEAGAGLEAPIHRVVAEDLLPELIRLRASSIHDTVTSAYNRVHFESMLSAEWRRARRHHAPLTVLLADIGRIDASRDPGFIHALERVAALLRKQCGRGGDVVARTDGTVFSVLLPDTNLAGAEAVAKRFCERIRHASIACDSVIGGRILLSIGGACASTPHDFAQRP